MTVDQAIKRSVGYTETVHIDGGLSEMIELSAACEDSVDVPERSMIEYWGTDDDGCEWRVHLHRIGSLR